jgi:N-acetylglucosamine-6-phosphate deacetylase
MTGKPSAFLAARIFDGSAAFDHAALLVAQGVVQAVVPQADVPESARRIDLGTATLAPGYVDLQVNGGDGLMLNDAPDLATLRRMADAHARLGATSILPTLITDTPAVTHAAIAAVKEAIATGLPGITGLHLEGPHLDPVRKGAHDPALIRPMGDQDLAVLIDAAAAIPVLMVTVAPQAVRPDQIAAMAGAGVLVSLGHTDADYDTCKAAAASGARCVTHLFNAMRQLGNRDPGVVGAALDLGGLSAGLIADGIHVHPASMAAALRAKQGPGRIFLVSDAMAVAGTALDGFTLNGRQISRRDGRLTLADGTLAGADLDLTTALRVLVHDVAVPVQRAVEMATSVPADLIRQGARIGHLRSGARADFVALTPDLTLAGVWRGGARLSP